MRPIGVYFDRLADAYIPIFGIRKGESRGNDFVEVMITTESGHEWTEVFFGVVSLSID